MARAWACVAFVLPALVLEAADAQAAGFAIMEQSGSGLGNAFAGAPTSIADPSSIFSNPASMGFMSGQQAAAFGSYIIPKGKFKGGSASAEPAPVAPFPIPITENALFDGNEDIIAVRGTVRF